MLLRTCGNEDEGKVMCQTLLPEAIPELLLERPAGYEEEPGMRSWLTVAINPVPLNRIHISRLEDGDVGLMPVPRMVSGCRPAAPD